LITILGLGFTGQRLAQRLLARNIRVSAAIRGDAAKFQHLENLDLVNWENAHTLPRGSRLLHSIPTLPPEETAALHNLISVLEPARVVYISSTGVYGAQQEVNETTPAIPNDAKGRQRLDEENWVAAGPWSSLILRPAAIYGPGRGVHTAIREGRAPRSTGVVSRIHVDDLAALADAALFSNAAGAWPVADDLPCSSAEIIAALDPGGSVEQTFEIAGRYVDGREIRKILGVTLKYSTWKTGIPASIAEEEERN
jgi:nucleoside-diphosphate-sugar epimerase